MSPSDLVSLMTARPLLRPLDEILDKEFEPPPLELRAGSESLRRQTRAFEDPLVRSLLDAMINHVLVLNDTRQIVYANARFLAFMGLESEDSIIGMRPGEALQCQNAEEHDAGCGMGRKCPECGAIRSILKGLVATPSEEECRITRSLDGDMEAFDFRVCATPFTAGEDRFVVFAIQDISNEKRRRALERIFFHDIMNTVGGLRNLLEFIVEEAPDENREHLDLAHDIFKGLVDEIETQKVLLAAETGELVPRFAPINSRDLLASIQMTYKRHESAADRTLVLAQQSAAVSFVTDQSLARRVLGNMVKNALEAENAGGRVTIGCDYDPAQGEVAFWVHNRSVMPYEVQLQVFQRSFTTKGEGRGLGAYSIKLLGEKYLRGRVSFESSLEQGTIFRVVWPKRHALDAAQTLHDQE